MHQGHRKRLRERLRDAKDVGFQDHELLELVLTYAIPRINVNPLAHKLIDHFGSFPAVINANYHELVDVEGMGESSATLLVLIRILCKRIRLQEHGKRPMLNTARAAAHYAADLFYGRRTEAFYVLMLDVHNRLIAAQLISEGTPNETAVSPRQVVEAAFFHKASSVIVAHNHPSGEVKPSSDDIALTKTLTKIFSLLGMRCNEHIIVGQTSAFAIIAGRTYELDQACESGRETDQMDNPHELLARIRALDKESLGILIEGFEMCGQADDV